MSIGRALLSAIGKLLIVLLIGAAFVAGFFWTLRQSLYSPEVSVPNIVGKDVGEGEAELNRDGLNIRRRATRYSADVLPNTILDQSPHPGEIIKSGQTVAVVVSRAVANEGETSVPITSETPNDNQNANSSSNTNNDNGPANQNSANVNGNRNKNKNSNNANNSNNTNKVNGNANRNANAGNANRNANDRTGNDNNGGGNRNTNSPGNRNTDPGNRNAAPTNRNANAGGRDRVVNGNRPPR